MLNYLIVILGAGAGGAFRFWLSNYVYKFLPVTFPYGTLAVNTLGSFILGIIIFYFDGQKFITPNIRLLLTVGFCGGFTTFSTFSLETINLLKESQVLFALINILANVILSLGAVYIAYILSK